MATLDNLTRNLDAVLSFAQKIVSAIPAPQPACTPDFFFQIIIATTLCFEDVADISKPIPPVVGSSHCSRRMNAISFSVAGADSREHPDATSEPRIDNATANRVFIRANYSNGIDRHRRQPGP